MITNRTNNKLNELYDLMCLLSLVFYLNDNVIGSLDSFLVLIYCKMFWEKKNILFKREPNEIITLLDLNSKSWWEKSP